VVLYTAGHPEVRIVPEQLMSAPRAYAIKVAVDDAPRRARAQEPTAGAPPVSRRLRNR